MSSVLGERGTVRFRPLAWAVKRNFNQQMMACQWGRDRWIRPLSSWQADFFATIFTGSAFTIGSAFREVSVVVKNTPLSAKPSSAVVDECNSFGCNTLRFVHFFIHFYDATCYSGSTTNMHIQNVPLGNATSIPLANAKRDLNRFKMLLFITTEVQ